MPQPPRPKSDTPGPRKRSLPRKAPLVRQRKPKRTVFPTDAESVQLRREGAAREAARVVQREGGKADFFGSFDVSSSQWKEPYRVEIRSLAEPLNTCSCQDHRMNRLGTCKHVERVLQVLVRRGKRRFKTVAEQGSDRYEIFFDARSMPPQLTLLRPAHRSKALDTLLNPLFDTAGIALDKPTAVWEAVEAAAAAAAPVARKRLRLSQHAAYWLARERRETLLNRLERRFETDVQAGRRTDNPVRLPLYPYQQQGMRHLAFKGRALLADEMGLGKTVQAIAAAELLRQFGQVRRVLVVSPASLKAEWEDQIAYFAGIRATLVFGLRPARLRIYAQEHAWTLCNYEQVRNDVDEINRLMVPDLVILDEAQRIKNWPTRTAKTIKRLQSPFAFVLTGTPLENRIEELYSLVEFVDPQVFGSLFRFQRAYMEETADNEVRPTNLDQLHRTVSRIMLRRRKHDVEDALPPRTDKNFFVPMTPEQRKRYAEFEYEAAKLAAILKQRPLTPQEFERLQRVLACMRMTCDTPYILDAECRDCPKLDELENILDELLSDDDAKVIVFSEWVRMLELVRELLDEKSIAYAEHTGRIPQQARREQIKRFKQEGACRVLLSSESGGTGLNLQVANIVINLDLPWNPAKLEQRIARAWRKHQPRSVQVINLVTENSIEAGMIGKLAYKTALADSVLDGVAFDAAARSESGRRAFAERVSVLLGGEPLPAPQKEVPVDAAADATRRIDHLIEQHADRILGIEQVADTGSRIIVPRPGINVDALRKDAKSAAGDQALVLTAEIIELLRRLETMGVLTFSEKLAPVHAAEGYAPLRGAERKTLPLQPEAAREVWRAAASERKAAVALGEIGLHAQAAPHLDAALRNAQQTLAALYAVAASDPLPEEAAASHRKLMRELADGLTTPPTDADTSTHAHALLEKIDRTLGENP